MCDLENVDNGLLISMSKNDFNLKIVHFLLK